jgi:hypothetical protein
MGEGKQSKKTEILAKQVQKVDKKYFLGKIHPMSL